MPAEFTTVIASPQTGLGPLTSSTGRFLRSISAHARMPASNTPTAMRTLLRAGESSSHFCRAGFTSYLRAGRVVRMGGSRRGVPCSGRCSGAVPADVEAFEPGLAEPEVGPAPGVVQHRDRAGGKALR